MQLFSWTLSSDRRPTDLGLFPWTCPNRNDIRFLETKYTQLQSQSYEVIFAICLPFIDWSVFWNDPELQFNHILLIKNKKNVVMLNKRKTITIYLRIDIDTYLGLCSCSLGIFLINRRATGLGLFPWACPNKNDIRFVETEYTLLLINKNGKTSIKIVYL